MAHARRESWGPHLITVDQPSLLSKWVGESEKGLHEFFKRAKQASPCILFLRRNRVARSRTVGPGGRELFPAPGQSLFGHSKSCTAPSALVVFLVPQTDQT